MAGDTEVLKSFLISLGFSIDESGFKKFSNGIGGITKGAVGAGAAIIGVAAAAQAMVVAFSTSMEKLYYASRRTGASVENIMGLESGAQRIGLAAGQATASLEAMSAAVRNQPALRGFMNMWLGTDTSKMDPTKAMLGVIKKLSEMPHMIGAQFAAMFGMDEQTFLMMKQGLPEMEAAMERHNQLLKNAGLNAKEAAESSMEYKNSLRDLGDKVSVLTDKIGVGLLPTFRELNTQTNAFLDSLLTLKKEDFSFKNIKGVSALVVKDLKQWDKEASKNSKVPDNWLSDLLGTSAVPRDIRNKRASVGKIKYLQTSVVPATGPLGLRLHNPGNLRSWGDTPTQGGFANFKNDEAGLSAMAANLLKKSSHGLNTIRQIIGDEKWGWSPASGEGNSKASTENYIKTVAKSMGISPDDVTNLRNPETLSRMMAAQINFEQSGKNPFSSAQLLSAANSRLGEEKQINIKTDIHVNGTGDPKSVADNVLNGMSRVYGNATRNTVARVE